MLEMRLGKQDCGCCLRVLWGLVAGEVGKKQVLPV